MTPSRTKFYLDRENKKFLGVCSGIADYTGFDVTMIRIGLLITLFMSGGSFAPVYFIAAWMAPKKPTELRYENKEEKKFWQGVRSNPKRAARHVRSRFREIDRRLADVETYVTSSHGRLAREIDSLR